MIKRTIEISQYPAHLKVRYGQLLITKEGKTLGSIPCEDIGVVVVDHPQASYSHAALAALNQAGAAVILCGKDHLPRATLLPLADHCEVVTRLHDQLAAKLPLKKQLWKQLVVAKIRGQAGNLADYPSAQRRLQQLAKDVRSGDPQNCEAQAARIFWMHWLGDAPFRRDHNARGVNGLLNYGYAIMRAAVARAIVAAGLQPALGLHHHNRGNAFCLADDLIEPLRPLVDDRARDLHFQGYEDLSQEAKARLLELLAGSVQTGDETGPLMVHLHRLTASLVKCFRGETDRLEIPTLARSAGVSNTHAAQASEYSPATQS